MTIASVIGYCLSAFGIGYACGYLKLIWNKSIEALD